MTIHQIIGFETGDGSELTSLGTGAAAQSSVVRSGAYAFQAGSSASNKTITNATQSVTRCYINIGNSLGAATVLIRENTTRLFVQADGSGHFQLTDNSATMGLSTTTGTFVFPLNTWIMLEVALDLAAGGVCRLWVNGILDIDVTHSTDVSATPSNSWGWRAGANTVYFDDIRIDIASVAPIGDGKVIARQGVAGTPTYDTFTKNGLSTAALCWSETPFGATNNCSSSTSAAKQTMNVAPFSSTQSGHGTEVIKSFDRINAMKVALVAKTASGDATGSILRRVNGVDTSATFTDTASDAYYESAFFTTTVPLLDTMEAGLIHGNNTRLTNVEDVWVMVDYTPVPQGPYDWENPLPRRYPVENRGFIKDLDVQLVGQDKFYRGPGQAPNVFDWRVPPPARRNPQLVDPQNQRAQYIVGKETLPNFTANLDRPFLPVRFPMENRGFIKDLDIQLIGQDTLPQQQLDLRISPQRLFARSLLEWIVAPIAPSSTVVTPAPASGGIGHRRKHRYPEPERSPFEGYTTEQLQRMVLMELPRLEKAEWQAGPELDRTVVKRETLDLLPPGFDLLRARAIEVGAGLLLAELRAARARRLAEDDEDEVIAMLLLLS